MGRYLRPTTLPVALAALAEPPDIRPPDRPWVVVAGATDHYPARVGRLPDEDVLDLTAIEGLRGIERVDGSWRIGGLTTWSDLAQAELPPIFDGLRRAARSIGGLQIQNRGTLAGNVCNASPAADGVPNLVALDAVVELASAAGTRSVRVATFVTGNRRTLRRPDEVVTAIVVPESLHDTAARATFLKLGSRAYLVISIAMVAAVVEMAQDATVARARVAVGACSEVAQRLTDLERELVGRPLEPGLRRAVRPEHLAGLRPIDDVRGSAEYRREAALVLVQRALEELAS